MNQLNLFSDERTKPVVKHAVRQGEVWVETYVCALCGTGPVYSATDDSCCGPEISNDLNAQIRSWLDGIDWKEVEGETLGGDMAAPVALKWHAALQARLPAPEG